MKNINQIFIVLSLCTFNFTFGQSVDKQTKIAGINLSQTINNSHYQETSTSICDTVFSFGTRPYPSGLTWDGNNLWYVDTSYIYKVSSSGIYIDSIINPSSDIILKGGDITYDGVNLWYADEQTAQLFKINPTSGNILQQFNLPSFGEGDPNGFGLAWDGVNIWHSQYDPSRIYKLNPTNGNIIDSLTTTAGILGIEWINGNLFGISDQQIFKINSNTGAFQDSTSWCVPFSLGLTWDGSYFWNVSGQDPYFGIPTGGKQKIYKINSDFTLSVNEHPNKKSDVEIFPNPTTQCISVRGEHIKTIEIYNVTGEIIYSLTQIKQPFSTEIDLSKISKGIYFAKIYYGTEFCTKKIVVQ